MTKRIDKSLVVNGTTVVTEAAWNAELDAKHEKLVELAACEQALGRADPAQRECGLADGRCRRTPCADAL